MADKKNTTPEPNTTRQIAPVIAELPDELRFICALCEKAQNMSERPKRDCYYFNATGERCPSMKRLADRFISLNKENESHRKYINAFKPEEFYTMDQIKELYNNFCKVEKVPSLDEFVDYCRAVLKLDIV
ncbi:MAG: hypothetical protein J6A54_06110 [Clostridia bacterium]|nr:hypothetical protein [Clostridia bacterium]